jgi:hypothetical protein
MFLYKLSVFSKWAKYIGLLSYILSLFSDYVLFSYLTLFVLFVVVEIALNASVFFGSIALLWGMLVIKRRYKNNLPSVETRTSKVMYSLPFEEAWAVVNGCFTQAYSHLQNTPVQRHAHDFMQLHEGRSFVGNNQKVENCHCCGKAILSSAGGVVVKVNNRSNDSLILGKGRYFNRSNHIAGNYVIVKHAEEQYSLMAHLKKDSMLVKAGERVVRGQKLARCGNSGNSTEPHLHFHLQNGPNFYTSVGLPIRFSDITIQPCPRYVQMDEEGVMNIQVIQHTSVPIARVTSDSILIFDVDSALDLMASVYYQSGARRLILDSSAIDERFFDLKTRLAGDILQKFVNYQTKLAIIGDFSVYTSKSLRDFIRESNSGSDIFFVGDEMEAITRLSRA